jgi:hypothetical protein
MLHVRNFRPLPGLIRRSAWRPFRPVLANHRRGSNSPRERHSRVAGIVPCNLYDPRHGRRTSSDGRLDRSIPTEHPGENLRQRR